MRNTRDTKLLCELSRPGRRAARLPVCDVPEQDIAELLPAGSIAAGPPALPEVTEPQIVRHFVNLSTLNMSVDTHFYPLGSCTMKYNPKRNERAAAMPGIADLHPYQPEETLQGMLALLYEMQEYLQEISGLAACSLQPAAGAHGELTALLVAAAFFRDRGQHRRKAGHRPATRRESTPRRNRVESLRRFLVRPALAHRVTRTQLALAVCHARRSRSWHD